MSQKLFDTLRLQLPNNINNFDSNVIIRKINKIVNSNDIQNGENNAIKIEPING